MIHNLFLYILIDNRTSKIIIILNSCLEKINDVFPLLFKKQMINNIKIYNLIILIGVISCTPPSSLDYVKVEGYKNIVEKYDDDNELFITLNKSCFKINFIFRK